MRGLAIFGMIAGCAMLAIAQLGPVVAGGGAGIVNPSLPPSGRAYKKKSTSSGSSTAAKQPAQAGQDAAAGGQGVASANLKVAAKKLFGHERRAADMVPRAIGFYSKGCLAGGKMLPPTGPYWQAMRLSRNRNWGHPVLIALLEKLAHDVHHKDGIRGLLVGDLAQPRGGPMLSGHKSHQVGLDADVWLREMPDRVLSRKQRETFPPISMLKNQLTVDKTKFTAKVYALIRRAAMYPEVARIGVNPAIKHALCLQAGGDKPWLGKIQSWPGHHYHMHIRIGCPSGSGNCEDQGRPRGTSCAQAAKWYKNLKAWMERPKTKKKKKKKKAKKRKPKPSITLAGLPVGCRAVLAAHARGGIVDTVVLPTRAPALAPAPEPAAAPAPVPVPAPALARGQQ